MRLMKNRFKEIDDEVPQDSKQLAREFSRWLSQLVPEGKRVILMLDVSCTTQSKKITL
jgi:hypothetical protein